MLRRTRVVDERPGVEVELVHQSDGVSFNEQRWSLLTIQTQNRTYCIDCQLRCMEVLDQTTKATMPSHPLLGARLVGGNRREGEVVHLSQPIPRPGSVAIFEQPTPTGAAISESSLVTRVVLRLHERIIYAGDAP
jgi:hypothetical protein